MLTLFVLALLLLAALLLVGWGFYDYDDFLSGRPPAGSALIERPPALNSRLSRSRLIPRGARKIFGRAAQED